MVLRILDVVDMQVDFVKASGRLSVPGAEKLIDLANDFFKAVPKKSFEYALFKLDTHFPDEYKRSPESGQFPLHCAYGTDGWKLAVRPDLLNSKVPVFYMTKNTFDMWGKNPLPKDTVLDLPGDEARAYENLRRITPDPRGLKQGVRYNSFVEGMKFGREVEVVMMGVASDFCVDDAILGYLERGAKVTVMKDLVTGIGIGPNDMGRAPGGRIEDVLSLPKYEKYVRSGQLALKTSGEVLATLAPKP